MIYYGRNHTTYTLGNCLGRGGEGEIYEIVENQSLVAKIYFNSKFQPGPTDKNPRKTLNEKIETMLEQPVQPYVNGVLTVAWPQDTLMNQQGQFIGYTMPRVKSKHHIFAASRERERVQLYPHYTWKTAITIAYNLSLAVKIIHRSNAVIGDMNSNNIMLDEHGHVTIIDTDSFNITNKKTGKIYKCCVGISEMLAPELQGKNLADPDSVFNEKTDDFSLAIHICTLLMNNCHPFGCASFNISHSSTSTNPVVYNIVRGICPYVTNSKAKVSLDSPDINMLPKDIKKLFDRAFKYTSSTSTKPSTIAKRPSAEEWQTALEKLLKSKMKTCKKHSSEVHIYPASYHKCPWCAIKNKVPTDNININYACQSWTLWLVCILCGLVFSPFMAKYFILICLKLCGVSFKLMTARISLGIGGCITGAIIAFYVQAYYMKSDYNWKWLLLGLTAPFATVLSCSLLVAFSVVAVYILEFIMTACLLIFLLVIFVSMFS